MTQSTPLFKENKRRSMLLPTKQRPMTLSTPPFKANKLNRQNKNKKSSLLLNAHPIKEKRSSTDQKEEKSPKEGTNKILIRHETVRETVKTI